MRRQDREVLRKGEMRHGSCLQISFPGEDRAWCVLAVSWLCHCLMGTSQKNYAPWHKDYEWRSDGGGSGQWSHLPWTEIENKNKAKFTMAKEEREGYWGLCVNEIPLGTIDHWTGSSLIKEHIPFLNLAQARCVMVGRKYPLHKNILTSRRRRRSWCLRNNHNPRVTGGEDPSQRWIFWQNSQEK